MDETEQEVDAMYGCDCGLTTTTPTTTTAGESFRRYAREMRSAVFYTIYGTHAFVYGIVLYYV